MLTRRRKATNRAYRLRTNGPLPVPVWMSDMRFPGGDKVFDATGRGNHGSLNGNVEWGALSGQGPDLDFPGNTSDWVQCGSTDAFNGAYITASAWFYYTNAGSSYSRIFERNSSFQIYLETGGRRLGMGATTSGGTFDRYSPAGADTYNTSEWVHAVWVWDGVYFRSYINGEESYANDENKDGTLTTSTADLYIGNRSSGDRAYEGQLRNLALWNVPLTPGDIHTLWKSQLDGSQGVLVTPTRRVWLPAAAAAPGEMTGSSSLSFTSSATLSATGNLSGSSSFDFSTTASLTATGKLSGTAALAFSSSATLSNGATGAMSGSSSLTFSTAGVAVDFSDYTIESYGGIEDTAGGATVSGGGTTLELSGNHWKKISLPYTVTSSTVLEFDFESSVEGEIQGIGFDTDDVTDDTHLFQLFGTQTWGIQNYNDYTSGTQHYVIPVGDHFTGTFDRLYFANDDDASNAAEVAFSNVEIYNQRLTGTGYLSGTSPLGFTATGTLTNGASGALSGTASLAFTTTANLTATGSLSGASSLVFASTANLTNGATGAMSGASSLTFTTSTDLTATGKLSGTSALAFTGAGTLSDGSAGDMSGSASLAFSTSANLTGTGRLSGTSALAFTGTGNLRNGASGSLSGSASLAFTTAAELTASGLLSGTSTLAFTTAGTFLASGALSGSSSLTFTTVANLLSDDSLRLTSFQNWWQWRNDAETLALSGSVDNDAIKGVRETPKQPEISGGAVGVDAYDMTWVLDAGTVDSEPIPGDTLTDRRLVEWSVLSVTTGAHSDVAYEYRCQCRKKVLTT